MKTYSQHANLNVGESSRLKKFAFAQDGKNAAKPYFVKAKLHLELCRVGVV